MVPFAPTTLTAELGRGPDKTVTYAALDGEKTKANLYQHRWNTEDPDTACEEPGIRGLAPNEYRMDRT